MHDIGHCDGIGVVAAQLGSVACDAALDPRETRLAEQRDLRKSKTRNLPQKSGLRDVHD